jgi:hypothetical protein
MRNPLLILAAGSLVASALMGCEAKPRDQFIQWVARDAWNPPCAEKAMVEIWKTENLRWKVTGEVVLVDVDATFKLGNDCGPFKAFESKRFVKKGFEMSKCKVGKQRGWSLPGMEHKRCWTGPRLLPGSAEAEPADKPAEAKAPAVAPEEAAAVAAPGTPAAAPAAGAAAAAAAPGAP